MKKHQRQDQKSSRQATSSPLAFIHCPRSSSFLPAPRPIIIIIPRASTFKYLLFIFNWLALIVVASFRIQIEAKEIKCLAAA